VGQIWAPTQVPCSPELIGNFDNIVAHNRIIASMPCGMQILRWQVVACASNCRRLMLRSLRHCRKPLSPRDLIPGALRICSAAWMITVMGCSVGPAFQHPDTNSPTAWRTADGDQAAWPEADWWRGFGSSQLDELIAQAEAANYDLAAAIARVREADAQARIAGAALLPSVGATAGLTRQRTTPSAASGQVEFPPDTTLVNPAITASYEFDFWGKNRASLEAAKASALASRYDEQVVKLTLTSAVATTYFQILELRDRLTVAQSNIAAAQKLLSALQAEQAAGTETVLDVVQQKTAVAALKTQVPPLTQQLQQSLDGLAILIGRSPEALGQPSGTLSDLSVPLVAPGLPSELLARRPDIAEAEAQLMAANADIKVARAAFFPSISLTAEGAIASLALAGITGPAGAVYAVTIGVTSRFFQVAPCGVGWSTHRPATMNCCRTTAR
jgi:outer membrane protein, multidrug efflux system